MTSELEPSFMECCLKLADDTRQDKLIQVSGVPVRVTRKHPGGKPNPEFRTSDNRLTADSNRWTSGKDGLKSTEILRVEGDSEIGPLNLELKKDTVLGVDDLQVNTELVSPAEKLKHYRHHLRLSAGKKNTHAEVLVEMRIELYLPLIFRLVAERRLKQSVDRQIVDFMDRLKNSLNH